MPEAITLLAATTGLRRLDTPAWRKLFATLAVYGATHSFNFTESTKWARDELRRWLGVPDPSSTGEG